jgi:carbonic anhydrase/acetyltransferase-like protein (isoleucine patch superfamily)
MPVIPFKDKHPTVGKDVFAAPDCWIIGDVEIGAEVSIFFGAVLRGDIQPIRVGARTNIQEHAMLHSSQGLPPCIIGEGTTIGHRAIIHGCKIGNNCTIGMGAVILDGAEIPDDCIVGAQSLVPMNFRATPGSLILGVPAKVVRPLKETEIEANRFGAKHYVEGGREYRNYFTPKPPPAL